MISEVQAVGKKSIKLLLLSTNYHHSISGSDSRLREVPGFDQRLSLLLGYEFKSVGVELRQNSHALLPDRILGGSFPGSGQFSSLIE